MLDRSILLKARLLFDTESWLTVALPTLFCAYALAANKTVTRAMNDAGAAHRAINEDTNRKPTPTLVTNPPAAQSQDSIRNVAGHSNFTAKTIHAFVREPRYG